MVKFVLEFSCNSNEIMEKFIKECETEFTNVPEDCPELKSWHIMQLSDDKNIEDGA